MNKALYDWYHALSQPEKNSVKQRFSESPVTARIIDFLEQTNRNFKNRHAVQFLYADELSHTDFLKLQNRYFKLRKKLLEEAQSQRKGTDELLTEEEARYYAVRQLIRRKEIETSLKTLIELESDCVRLNIFELLPDVYNDLIYCEQVFQNFEKAEHWTNKLIAANEVRNDLMKLKRLNVQGYQAAVLLTPEKVVPFIEQMKELTDRYPQYPRFKMIWHIYNLALRSTYGASTGRELEVHINQLQELRSKHRNMPVESYRPNYVINTDSYIKSRSMTIHYLNGDLELAYEAMLDYWSFLEANVQHLRFAERDFVNLITLQLYTHRYEEALDTSQKMEQFITRHHSKDQALSAWQWIGAAYAFGHAVVRPEKPTLVLRKIDQLLKVDPGKTEHAMFGQVHLTKGLLHWQFGSRQKAVATLRGPEVQQYLEKQEATEFLTVLENLTSGTKEDVSSKAKLKSLSEDQSRPQQARFYFGWACKMLP